MSYEGGGSAGRGGASLSSSKSPHLAPTGWMYYFYGYALRLRHTEGREERRTVFGYGGRDDRGDLENFWREGTLLLRRE